MPLSFAGTSAKVTRDWAAAAAGRTSAGRAWGTAVRAHTDRVRSERKSILRITLDFLPAGRFDPATFDTPGATASGASPPGVSAPAGRVGSSAAPGRASAPAP